MTFRPSLLLARKYPAAVEARAARDYAATLNADDRILAGDALVAAAEAAAADAILVAPGGGPATAAVIAALPARVRMIATFSVGTDHIDLEAARARGIVVANTPDVLTDATADIALLLMLGAARRAYEGQTMLRAGAWTGWTPTQLMGTHLGGKRLGILGMGRIGRAVAARARAFGMSVRYHNRRRLAPELEDGALWRDGVEALLADSDVLSLNAPAGPETERLLDARRLALLPPGAIVVNTARGALIDDAALIAALKAGRIAAAGLDVFAGEPQVDPGYLALPNAYLLPHLGSATVETRDAMGFRALDNLDAFFAGRTPPDRVA